MKLDLTTVEAKELESALANHLLELRNERVHTDSRAFRHDLQETIDRLEAIACRLGELVRVEA